MRYIRTLQKIFLTLALFAGAFQFAYAGVADSAIKTWNTPLPEGTYQYSDTMIYQGTVQIPAGWIGRVRVCKDVGGSTCRTSFVGSQSYDNTALGTTLETFSIDTGVWASGAHTARVAFDGAAACRLTCADTDYTCQNTNNSDGDPTNDWCPQSTENQVIDQQYPVRNITVGPPPQPSLVITPNPLHFWDHSPGSAVVTQTVSLTNVGAPGTVAAGSVTQLTGAGKFGCQSGCTYSLQPGDAPHDVVFAFTPPVTEADWTGSFGFSCAGCVATNQTLDVDGRTVISGGTAEITLEWEGISFGVVGVGSSKEAWVHITNTGGSAMDGTIDLNDPQISCESSCDFSLDAGEDEWKRLYYQPTIATVLSGVTATFRALSGGASPLVTPVTGEGTDEPILGLWSPDTGNDVYDGSEIEIRRINVGETGTIEIGLYNAGAGILSASLAGLPSGVFTCISGCGPYSGLRSYNLTGDATGLRMSITLSDATEQVIPLTFTDTTPGGSGQVIHVTIRVIPNADPVPEMVGGYPCRLNFGNVFAGESSLPLPDADLGDPYNYQEECGIRNAGVGSLKVTLPNFSVNGTGRYDCVVGAGYSCGTFYLGSGEEARFVYRFTALAGDPDTYMHHWDPVDPAYGIGFEGLPSWDSIHIHAYPMSISLMATSESDPAYDFGVMNVSASSSYKSYLLSLEWVGGRDDPIHASAFSGSISYTIGDTPHFFCTRNCAKTLSFTGSIERSARVVFNPLTTVGPIAETMSIPFTYGGWPNHPVVVPLTLPLQGVGNDQPLLEVSGDISSSLDVDFGSVNVGTPKTLTITIANIGVGDMTGSFDAFLAPFTCIGPECSGSFTIPAGQSRDVSVRFTPPSGVFYQKTVILSTTGGNKTITLSGTGKFEPELTVSTNFINFDTLTDPSSQTNVGDVRTTTFRITNSGLGTMTGTVALTNPTSNFLLPSDTFSLLAGQSKDIDVQFAPVRDTVSLSGQVTIIANDISGPWTNTKTIDLTGIGAFASLTDFRGPPPNFGPVVFGKDKTLVLTLRNAGVRPLGQGTFEFPVGSPFTCIAPIGASGKCEYDIGPAGSPTGEQSLTVKFTPKGLGAVSIEMTLSSLSDYVVEFTGTGIPPRFNYKEQ